MPVGGGVLPPDGGRRGRERAATAARARRRQLRRHVRRSTASSATRASRPIRSWPGRPTFAVLLFDASHRRARRRARGRHGRPAPDRRRERRRREVPRPPRREHARRDRLRLAGRVAGRGDPRRGAHRSSASSPTAGRPSGCGRSARRSAPSPPSRTRMPPRQDIVVTITTSRDPVLRGEWLREGALVCAAGANDPAQARARQRRPRARELRLLRLEGERAARVGRPDRARRGRRARLARGARAAGGRRR